jgi:5-methylcytosine-specific restriction endonuclease McrA
MTYDRNRYLLEKDKRKEYYEKNKTEIRAKKHATYIKNKSIVLEKTKEYTKNHPEIALKSQRNYNKRHPEVHRWRESQRRAAKRMNGGELGFDEWIFSVFINGSRCSYCGKKSKLDMDHVVPLHSGGKHDIYNIVPACQSCNRSKQDKSLIIWLMERYNGK